ncbi:GNAT family N-acetyltransferase [Clostridium tarantellae]|uniref:GNAT family N-acetyltransferase n=1 Tax=Clostridium tarantellae TaxID=39493 RepID=A0A6I1MKV9_9CLOT|nr:GNAT family N-acetyltransferase [Clostridium tarantellae]MPQ44035.1 GNAT family N-acetyltransferase [Clostridium tarantellae]
MNRLKLILPTLEDKDKIMDYKKEFIEHGDSLDGTAGLGNIEIFEDWYSAICDNSKEETVREGLVPSTTYMAISLTDNKLIGMIDIRHGLNDYLLNFGGHIGYSIRKCERRKGYATEMLSLALLYCKELKIKKVLLTCDKNNMASSKTIIKNGGNLENEVSKGERITQRYWINLNDES